MKNRIGVYFLILITGFYSFSNSLCAQKNEVHISQVRNSTITIYQDGQALMRVDTSVKADIERLRDYLNTKFPSVFKSLKELKDSVSIGNQMLREILSRPHQEYYDVNQLNSSIDSLVKANQKLLIELKALRNQSTQEDSLLTYAEQALKNYHYQEYQNYLEQFALDKEKLGRNSLKEAANAYKLKANNYLNRYLYSKALDCMLKTLNLDNNWENNYLTGSIFLELESYSNALIYGKRALNLISTSNRQDSSSLAASLNLLSAIYLAKRQTKTALKYCKDALSISYKLSNKNCSELLNTINRVQDLGTIYEVKGNNKIALDYFKKAEELYSLIYCNRKVPDLAFLNCNLGIVYANLGKQDSAHEHYLVALEIYKINYGEFHPQVAKTLSLIASVNRTTGKLDTAITYYMESIEMQKKIYQDGHPDLGRDLGALGLIYFHEKNYAESKEYFQKSFDILSSFYPSNSPMLKNLNLLIKRVEVLSHTHRPIGL